MRYRTVLAILLVACGGAESTARQTADDPPLTAEVTAPLPAPNASAPPAPTPPPEPVAPPAPPARPVVAEGEPLPLLAAGDDFTCLLYLGRLTCVGAVPTAEGVEARTTRELDADRVFAGAHAYCTARTGQRQVRCFGSLYRDVDERLDERWARECDDESACIDARHDAYQARPFEFPTRGPIHDLAGFESRVCAVAGEELSCWGLFDEDPERPIVTRAAGARDVEVGQGMACVRTAAGAVRCREDYGDRDVGPFQAITNLPPVARMVVSGMFGCAWTEAGEAYCWGSGLLQIDDEAQIEERVAARVPVFDGARAMSATEGAVEAVCVIDASGRLRCWGQNPFGILGAPTPAGRDEAVALEPAVEGAQSLALGHNHACAIDERRVLVCWGGADHGALGLANARRNYAPSRVPLAGADALSLHGDRSCVRTSTGWRCFGRLGTDDAAEPWTPRSIAVPREATPTSFGATDCVLAAGELTCGRYPPLRVEAHPAGSACVMLATGGVACGLIPQTLRPLEAVPDVARFAVDGSNLVTYTRAGELTVFSHSIVGQGSYDRLRSLSIGPDVTHLGVDYEEVCFRRRDASVWCVPLRRGEPQRLALPPVQDLVHGSMHFCASTSDGVHCWGSGSDGRLGVAEVQAATTPAAGEHREAVRVPGLPPVVELAAGAGHTCARTAAGEVFCWGRDGDGQLGVRPEWWRDGPVAMDVAEP